LSQIFDCSRTPHVRHSVILPGTVVVVQTTHHAEAGFHDEGEEEIHHRSRETRLRLVPGQHAALSSQRN